MKHRIFIIHGWDDAPTNGWFPWLKKQLATEDVEVHLPAMPDAAHPEIETWVNFFKHTVGVPEKNTFFVGHSIGCQTILRYLMTIPDAIQVGGVVMVAPWVNLKPSALEDEDTATVARPWLERPLDWPTIRKHLSRCTAILSDDDQFVPVEDGKIFTHELGAHLVIEHQKRHLGGFDGVNVLPSALMAVRGMLEK